MPRRRRLIVHSYDDDLRERLRDPEYVVMYLEALKEDDDAFRLALRHVAEAHGFAGAGEVIDAAIEKAIGALMALADEMVGQRFGKWSVVENLGPVQMGQRRWSMVRCVCECGSESTVRPVKLTTQHTTQCKKCSFNDRPKKAPKPRKSKDLIAAERDISITKALAAKGVQRGTLRERVLRMIAIDIQTGCWNWTGNTNKVTGYGYVYVGPGKQGIAHRAAYRELVGPIPAGLVLDHLCRNKRCVNPKHLEPVTQGENVRRGDRVKRRQNLPATPLPIAA
jgi:hypothetical protein